LVNIKKIQPLLFQNKTVRQIFIKNISWQLLTNILVRTGKFFLIPYSSYVLGVTQFGNFYYVLSLVAIFYIFADFGLSPYLNREYNLEKDVEKQSKLLSTYFITRFFTAIVCFIFSFFLILIHFNSDLIQIIVVIIFLAFIESCTKMFNHVLNARKRSEVYSIISLISNFVLVVLGFLTLKYVGTLFPYVCVYLLCKIIELSLQFVFFRKDIRVLSYLGVSESISILKRSFPLMISGVIGIVLTSTDTLMIKWVQGVDMVAYYQAPFRIIMTISVIYTAIHVVLYPILSEYVFHKDRFVSILKNGLSVSFLLGFPVILGGMLLAEALIIQLFGARFLMSVSVFKIMLFSTFVSFIVIILNMGLLSLRKENENNIISLISTAVNICLNILLIFKYGILGVAFATVLANILDVFLSYNLLKKELKTQFVSTRSFFNALISSLIMAFGLFLTSKLILNTIILIILGGIFYLLSLLLLRESSVLTFFKLLNKNLGSNSLTSV